MIEINEKIANITQYDANMFYEFLRKKGFKWLLPLPGTDSKREGTLEKEFENRISFKDPVDGDTKIFSYKIAIRYHFENHSYTSSNSDQVERFMFSLVLTVRPHNPNELSKVGNICYKLNKELAKIYGFPNYPVDSDMIFDVNREIDRLPWLSDEYKNLEKVLITLKRFDTEVRNIVRRRM